MIRAYEEDGLVTDHYDPERDNAEALALESRVVQGSDFSLSFHRSAFHRRAENFRDWAIFTGRIDGRLVALSAAAMKDMVFFGEPVKARFSFDLRVDPEFRNRKIGRRLVGEALEWRQGQDDVAYSWIVDDNRASQAVGDFWTAKVSGAYRYLVYPTYRHWPATAAPASATMAEVHRLFVEHAGPFDLYSDPTQGNTAGHVQSWVLRRGDQVAACSAWDNRDILGEVVHDIPGHLAMIGSVFRTWPLRMARLPHIPQRGEALRSWYLFDCFSTDPQLARDLFHHVAATAREREIDYCYIIHDQRDDWIEAVRGDLPQAFAPILPYNLWAGWPRAEPFPDLGRVYVDIRDL